MNGYIDQTPVAAPGIAAPDNPTAWKAPATGTPLSPSEVAGVNHAAIVDAVVNRLTVPKGPIRTVNVFFGLSGATVVANALNSPIVFPIFGGPGIIRALDFQAQLVVSGAATGFLQLLEGGDQNSPVLRTFLCNVGAAGTFLINHSLSPAGGLPFLAGITAKWTPIVAGFTNSVIVMNIDYESIPIGQRG